MSQGTHTTTQSRRRRPERAVRLNVPSTVRPRVSERDFAKLCRGNPDLRLEWAARGELIVMAPAGTDSGGRNARLTLRLGQWAEADGRGRFFDSSTGYRLPLGTIRAPDASWIQHERWEVLTDVEKQGFAPICPDFAAELCSPSDDRDDVREKMNEYIANGLRLGWLIDPRDVTVEVYRPGRSAETLTRPATLSGEDVLPGFVLDLKGILFD